MADQRSDARLAAIRIEAAARGLMVRQRLVECKRQYDRIFVDEFSLSVFKETPHDPAGIVVVRGSGNPYDISIGRNVRKSDDAAITNRIQILLERPIELHE